jgi:hypothetical protein
MSKKKISWSLKVQVTGGPSVAASDTIEVDAYDVLEATVAAGDSETINVQPGDDAQFLLITATSYKDMTYTVDGGSGITLDGAHVLIGEGAVSLLGSTQNQFVFSNAGTEDVTVSILVGRDAIV